MRLYWRLRRLLNFERRLSYIHIGRGGCNLRFVKDSYLIFD
jgi:hypothetical protein